MLHSIASLYDPLGLVTPFVLAGKILLQQAWKTGLDWDDPCPQELQVAATQWWRASQQLQNIQFPRWLGLTDAISVHLFADASELGYGCCVFFVAGGVSQLVFAKSKVTPLKSHTLARLELQAVFIGARYLQFVVDESRVNAVEVHAWTDSMTAKQWISGPPHRWKTYVATRVAEIQRLSHALDATWHHCPGKDNPADLASRGSGPEALDQPLWKSGPPWLTAPSEWPITPAAEATDVVLLEQARVQVVITTPPELQWWTRLSSWRRVIGVLQRMLSWKYRNLPRIDLEEKAEKILWRTIQTSCFPQELMDLRAGKSVQQGSRLAGVRPFIDNDGILRAARRLQMASLDVDAKYPVVLASHDLTTLLLRHTHQSRLHQGVEGCLAAIQRRFVIFSCRRLLREVKRKCVVCQRQDARPATEDAAPLLPDRVHLTGPFEVVGVDHAGPLLVRNRNQDRGKVWILLFVCAAVHAVHLELVDSTSADDFILAYRRFVARYGIPRLIRSDNGTGFVAAARTLSSTVKWVFNPPASPWHGGFYERLVAVVKSPLRRVLGRPLLTWQEMATLLTEVASIVNDRPLTHVGDVNDLCPLNPNVLLGAWPAETGASSEEPLSRTQAERRQRYLLQLRQSLSQRWASEYLLSLQNYRPQRHHSMSVGDVVLVVDPVKRRTQWKLALIEELYRGRDGLRRVARVRISKSTFLRPVQRLVPLELESSTKANE